MMISVVIPCYRSAHTVADIVHRVQNTIEADGRYDYEVICINDNPPDETLKVLKGLAAESEKVKVISFTRNFGQHSALMAGFNNVSGDVVICLDDDGQNPPEDMFKLIDKLDDGYDLVSARYVDEHRPLIRQLGSKVAMSMSSHLIGMPKGIELNSFCTFKRFIADEVVRYTNPYPFVHGLMLRVTRNIANVDMVRSDREEGSSGYTISKLFSLWLNGFTAFSVTPLRAASVCGALFASIGFIAAIVVVVRKFVVPEISAGYSSLMAAILFFFGLNMLFLGLIGEYIGRMYICMNVAPQFAIRDTYNLSRKER